MSMRTRVIALVGLGLLGTLLVGCPGMPGATGGSGSQQNTPPGVLPPPGLESGGVRTLMGTTITPPDDSYLLVRYGTGSVAVATAPWRACRRVSAGDGILLVEGLNYDGRDEKASKDTNQLYALSSINGFEWKYEARPAPPAQATPKGQQKPGGKPK